MDSSSSSNSNTSSSSNSNTSNNTSNTSNTSTSMPGSPPSRAATPPHPSSAPYYMCGSLELILWRDRPGIRALVPESYAFILRVEGGRYTLLLVPPVS